MAHDAKKAALISALDSARSQLAVHAGALRADLDVSRRARRSFVRHRFVWFGAAAFTGVLLAKIPSRTKKVVIDRKGRNQPVEKTAVKAGLLLGVLKITFDLIKPLLFKWASRRASDYVTSYTQRRRDRQR